MAISLYNVSVSSYLQILGGMTSCLEKGLAHCRENGVDPEDLVETSLFPDMNSFSFQVEAMTHHSIGALTATKTGSYYATQEAPRRNYSELQQMMLNAQETLRQVTPAEIDGRADDAVIFRFKDLAIPFTVENFLLSFALPNFHFHAATTYDILRMKGVPIGKINYLGQMRVRT